MNYLHCLSLLRRARLLASAFVLLGQLLPLAAHAQNLTLNGAATTCTSATITTLAGAANIATQPAGCIITPAIGTNPQLTSVTPACVAVGGAVTAAGANLTGATSATVNGIAATISANTATSISIVTPTGVVAGTASLSVMTPVGTSNTLSYTVGSCAITPSITSVSPTSAVVGAAVSITGANLQGASITINGVSATPTSNTATTIDANVPAGATAGAGSILVTTAGGSASIAFSVTIVADKGSVSTSIEGVAIPDPSKSPNIIPGQHTGLNGAGINAYAVDQTRCAANAGAPTNRLWLHSIDLTAYASASKDHIALAPGAALSYKFTPKSTDRSSQIVIDENTATDFRASLMTISTEPCDFNGAKALSGPNRDYCYVASDVYNRINYSISATDTFLYTCNIRPGTTYYLNIKFLGKAPDGSLTLDSCTNPTYGVCGGVLQFK